MENDNLPITRRELLGAGVALTTASGATLARATETSNRSASATTSIEIALTVNGVPRSIVADPRVTLLDALREHLDLNGSKKGCDQGQCGACTVHVEGRRVLACLTLAQSARGKRVTTIEGLTGPGGSIHPIQQAFLDNDALQCGYCTPGQIMSAVACVNEGHTLNDEMIREYMSGNLCRCSAYRGIVAAVKVVAAGKSA